MDYYYITHHIDIEALHPNRLLELLNSYRLDSLTKYKQLTDIYYSIEDGILFQLGFQLYDLVLFNNHRYYIKGRRSSGSFALVSVEGLKNEKRSYKKITLLAHTNAYLINHYVNV